MRFLKASLYGISGIVILIAIAIGYITQVLDPNDLKPTLIKVAKERGISLEIKGEIAWAFMPWLRVQIDSIDAKTAHGSLKATRMEGDISPLSLFSDTIIIERLVAIDPKVTINDFQKSKKLKIFNISSEKLEHPFIVRMLSVTNGEFRRASPELSLKNVNFNTGYLTPATTSEFEFEAIAQYGKLTAPLSIKSTIKPHVAFNGFTIHNFKLKSRGIALTFNGYLSANTMGAIGGEGQIHISNFSPRNWLAAANLPIPITQNLTRFTLAALNTDVKLSDEMLSLQDLKLKLDESEFSGQLDFSFKPLNLNVDGAIDSIDLDSYFWETRTTKTLENNRQFSFFPGAYKIDIQTLKVNSTEYTNLQIEVGVSSDEITLGRFSVEAFGGSLQLTGTHLTVPEITLINGTINKIDLKKFALHQPLAFSSGQINGAFDLRGAGKISQEIQHSLSGSLRISITDALLQKINFAEALCNAMDESYKSNAEPNQGTLRISVDFEEGVGIIDILNAEIANVNLNGNGRISFLSRAIALSGQLQIPLDGKFQSCKVPEKIRGLRLPFNCRGKFTAQSFSCRFDSSALSAILQN